MARSAFASIETNKTINGVLGEVNAEEKGGVPLPLSVCLAMIKQEPGLTKKGIALISDPSFQQTLSEKFPALSEAIFDVLLFISEIEPIHGAKVPYYNPILILACYRYHHKKDWAGMKDEAARFFFTAFLSGVFLKLTQKLMKDLLETVKEDSAFSLKKMQAVCQNHGQQLDFNVDARRRRLAVCISRNFHGLVNVSNTKDAAWEKAGPKKTSGFLARLFKK